ncbi:MAG: malate dehydrogenase [Dehalococcoidales bacterium]
MTKISVIGAGNVGALCAKQLADRGYARITLLDVVEGLAQGKGLDIQESMPVAGTDTTIIGTGQYQETAGSDLAIITAGVTRKPGMTRDDLLTTNMNIVSEVTRKLLAHSPKAIIIVATNPVDAMTYLVKSISGLPRSRVFGLSGVLDSSRLRSFIAKELNVSAADIFACILGQHGDSAVVIPRLTTVHGIPITSLLSREKIDRLVERAVRAGAEIVELLKTGSASFAPSAAIARMADAVVLDKKEILPCAVCMEGEYGLRDTTIGVPVKLGREGIEQIIELELRDDEKAALKESADVVRGMIKDMGI